MIYAKAQIPIDILNIYFIERTYLVLIDTDCIFSCKSNHHIITTKDDPYFANSNIGTFILNYYELCVFRIEYIIEQIYIILMNKF